MSQSHTTPRDQKHTFPQHFLESVVRPQDQTHEQSASDHALRHVFSFPSILPSLPRSDKASQSRRDVRSPPGSPGFRPWTAVLAPPLTARSRPLVPRPHVRASWPLIIGKMSLSENGSCRCKCLKPWSNLGSFSSRRLHAP